MPQAGEARHRLGEHGGRRHPGQSERKHHHQQIIEQHVEQPPDHHDEGDKAGAAIVAQQRAERHRQHRKDAKPGVGLQVGEPGGEDLPLRPHPGQHGLAITDPDKTEQCRGQQHHHQRIADDMAGFGRVALPQIEGDQRRGPHADQRPHRIEHGADGISQHQTGHAILTQHMANEDAIDGDIDAGDQHGRHGRGYVTPEKAR